jgi:dihydrofolate reductase
VVGSTADASRWTNTTVLEGDPVEAVRRVRAEHSGNLYVHGSQRLAQTLFEHDLVDQLNLMVFPVVLGTGKRIFGETSGKKKLALVDFKVVGDGVAILIYKPSPADTA